MLIFVCSFVWFELLLFREGLRLEPSESYCLFLLKYTWVPETFWANLWLIGLLRCGPFDKIYLSNFWVT